MVPKTYLASCPSFSALRQAPRHDIDLSITSVVLARSDWLHYYCHANLIPLRQRQPPHYPPFLHHSPPPHLPLPPDLPMTSFSPTFSTACSYSLCPSGLTFRFAMRELWLHYWWHSRLQRSFWPFEGPRTILVQTLVGRLVFSLCPLSSRNRCLRDWFSIYQGFFVHWSTSAALSCTCQPSLSYHAHPHRSTGQRSFGLKSFLHCLWSLSAWSHLPYIASFPWWDCRIGSFSQNL